MKRYNIFYQVHKGLRVLLYETAIYLQQTDFTREEEIAEVNSRLSGVVHLFDKHAHTEDSLILPAIDAYEPSVADAFEGEHKEDIQLSLRLKSVLTALTDADNDYDRTELGISMNILFVEFVAFNLKHMAKEEMLLNKLLWRYYSDEELMQLTKKIVQEVKPEDIPKYNKWMLKGLNNSEIAGWLKNVKNNAPCEIFLGLMKQANEELDARRWEQVQEQLSEGLLLA
jgi:hypothetical protein